LDDFELGELSGTRDTLFKVIRSNRQIVDLYSETAPVNVV